MSEDDDRIEGLRTRVVRVIREHTGLHERFALPIAAEIIETFWREVEGERVYVPTRDPELPRKVVAEFNGRNRDELCAKHGISRSTFYVYLARSRTARPATPSTQRDEFSL